MHIIYIPKKNFFYSLLYIFVFFNLINLNSYALDQKDNETDLIIKTSSNVSKNSNDKKFVDQYILDTGDILFIAFSGLDIYSGDYLIDREGFLDLPEIGKYYAKGKTISEIIGDLNLRYEEFIFDPDLLIEVRNFRPINVFITGEIAKPGLYNLSKFDKPNQKEKILLQDTFPKLFDLIRASGGVTNYSDLSKIEVTRTNPIHSGGGKKQAKINLLNLILKGEQEENIYLFDDDIVFIPRSENIVMDQILAINKVNLNPDFINIIVSGNVINSGPQIIKKGSSLNQAVAFSGGKKLFSGKVEFIRFNDNGNVERRLVRYNPNAKSNSFNNPVLMEGDIINIRRTPVGVFAEVVNEFSGPLFTSYSIIDLFGGFD